MIEHIWTPPDADGSEHLATVIRAEEFDRPGTTFFTPPDAQLQVGVVKRRAGEEIPRHVHIAKHVQAYGVPEVLMVLKGRCTVHLYGSDRRTFCCSVQLKQFDVIVLHCGGHSFRADEDVVLYEVRQGPYGPNDKVQF